MNVMNWDSNTQMPKEGAATRGLQTAALARITYERFTSDKTIALIEAAKREMAQGQFNVFQERALQQAEKAFRVTRSIPVELISQVNALKATAQQAWIQARKENDFALFEPYLEQVVHLNRKLADAIGYQDAPYDALLERYEPGMTLALLAKIFGQLKAGLKPILSTAAAAAQPRVDFLSRDYPETLQREFGLEIIRKFGYDMQRGRLDIAVHPFEISFTRQDVRITTRYKRDFLPAAIFGLFHESGHGLYEQGADPAITRTVLTTDLYNLYAVSGVSFGMHESQSRLWENLVGRARPFWVSHFLLLQSYFPDQLADVDVEAFYRAVNTVKPGYIRVEADEVTYNFHIMLRVEIEAGLLDGSIKVSELPEVWNTKMKSYLGITPPNDTLGVLQDVHWAHGYFGTFCTYTIGNIMSAQFFEAARRAVPDLDENLQQANYRPLLQWLTENIYRHGRAYSPDELLRKSTGKSLDTRPYLDYLTGKYAELYAIDR
jgi:carboxypeptidase Taq